MSNWFLYIHINKTNNKVYVGISQGCTHRWDYGHGYKYNVHFHNSIEKYGWGGFRHIIVRSGLTLTEANELERRYIYLFRADNPTYGYNQTKGGDGCDKGVDWYNPDVQKEYYKNHYLTNKSRRNQQSKEYYEKNKEIIRQRQHEAYLRRREKQPHYWLEGNKEKKAQYEHEYYEKTKEKRREYNRLYRLKNKQNDSHV